MGLAAIQLAIVGSQERINWLYEHTPVEAELMPVGGSWVASIRRDTVQALMDSGYITDYHFEASVTVGSGYAPYDASQETGPAHLGRGESRGQGLLGFESERAFLSSVGSGAGVTITYHEGWNGSLFAREWTGDYDPADSDTLFPVVVPKAVYDELELEPGAKLQVFARSRRPFEVAGYYEGFTGGSCPDPLLLPLSACRTLCSGRITYSKAHVTLDPSLNRQLDQFEAALTEIADRQHTNKLQPVIWDEELRQAVAPLEGSIQLMRALYPVTLVLSLLCAAGVAALFIMTSAKEAAILRVQGTTKLRTQVILGLQQAVACSVGLAAGLCGGDREQIRPCPGGRPSEGQAAEGCAHGAVGGGGPGGGQAGHRHWGAGPGPGGRHRAGVADSGGWGSRNREVHFAAAGVPQPVQPGPQRALHIRRGIFGADQDAGGPDRRVLVEDAAAVRDQPGRDWGGHPQPQAGGGGHRLHPDHVQ